MLFSFGAMFILSEFLFIVLEALRLFSFVSVGRYYQISLATFCWVEYFKCSLDYTTRSFHRAANSVLVRLV